jgi:hypothetical protein
MSTKGVLWLPRRQLYQLAYGRGEIAVGGVQIQHVCAENAVC